MRRAARSAAIAAIVAVIVLGNVPSTGVHRPAAVVGLGQDWAVFAPNPLAARIELEADVLYANGSSELWRPPPPSAAVQERGYRWQQWARALALDERSELWEPAARWIARVHERDRRRPVAVTLRRRFAVLPAPGARDRRLRWSEFDFFTLELG